jgi:hypothetical protein
MKFANVNFINKIAGGAILGVLLLVFYSYALWGINSLDLLSEANKKSSVSYDYLETLPLHTQGLMDDVKPIFKGFWDQMLETFDDIKSEADKVQ